MTPLLWLVKTPADMNELRDLHSSALILIASKIIMAMLAIRRGFRTLVLHYVMVFNSHSTWLKDYNGRVFLTFYTHTCILDHHYTE